MSARSPWNEVCDLLFAALEEPPASRADYVRRTCSHRPDLLEEVLELLALHEEDFLETAGAPIGPPRELGGYRLVELIGSGGMGDVYRAVPLAGGTAVAVKLLPVELSSDPTLRARFLREARAVVALDHPRIVRVHEVFEQDGHHGIVMELLSGRTLKRLLGEETLALPLALRIAHAVAEGLAYAHGRGVVHRDMKPGNVMISPERRATLMDFGLAKIVTEEVDVARVTKSGDILGTAAYMSPEQARGEKVDARSDVFSFGCVLYELVTGRRAFPGDFIAATVGVAYEEPVEISALNREVPEPVRRLVHRALVKDPVERDLSMAEARDLLAGHAS